MPVVKQSSYQSTRWLINGHFQTIFPALTRKVNEITYRRERIATPDDDFLDLDWSVIDSDSLVIISHGLEGSSERPYIHGMVNVFNDNGIDALAWNFRGCSDEMNHQRIFYHSGATYDLHTVIQHVESTRKYNKVFLVGFSLGGNLTLKYIGEKGSSISALIAGAIVYSVPLDLHSSSIQLNAISNYFYAQRFLKSLMGKVKAKASIRDDFDLVKGEKIKTLMDFDDVYTAPIHGYENALDYYSKCSSIKFVEGISIPTLVVNAQNDPFLPEDCYPVAKFEHHKYAFFEVPETGGHVGFYMNNNPYYWSEYRAISFLRDLSLIA